MRLIGLLGGGKDFDLGKPGRLIDLVFDLEVLYVCINWMPALGDVDSKGQARRMSAGMAAEQVDGARADIPSGAMDADKYFTAMYEVQQAVFLPGVELSLPYARAVV